LIVLIVSIVLIDLFSAVALLSFSFCEFDRFDWLDSFFFFSPSLDLFPFYCAPVFIVLIVLLIVET
jgi:hypothetical protein